MAKFEEQRMAAINIAYHLIESCDKVSQVDIIFDDSSCRICIARR